jgi:type VI secretion system protein ImpL
MSKRTKIWLLVAGCLLGYSVSVWFAVSLLRLSATDVWRLRVGLWIIGIIAAAVVFWFFRKPTAEEPTQNADREIDSLIAASRSNLAESRVAGKTSLDRLPLVLLAGPPGSTKTTLALHSGLDPELLAGEGVRDTLPQPTPLGNLWYGGGVLLLEAGGKLLRNAPQWTRLLRHLKPRALREALSRRSPPSRLAVVCLGCDELQKPEAALATARLLRERLAELSLRLGIRLPVYVVFTKADQLSFFAEFVRNLTGDEVRDVLGETLPMDQVGNAGSFADRESQRLNAAFQHLFQALASRRLEVLAREYEPELAGRAYEFPREFRKLAGQAVPFLIELCRPSQLRVTPVLRGFYFTGVRAVMAEDPASTLGLRAVGSAHARGAAATGLFSQDDVFGRGGVAQAAEPRAIGREHPEWVFLPRLFSDLILRDDAAMALSRGGAGANVPRRFLLATAAALFLALGLGFLVSFLGNRNLARRVQQTSHALAMLPAAGWVLPSPQSLRLLDSLRSQVDALTRYERSGPPWSLRFGLYLGSELLPPARRAYFEGFGKQLFSTTRVALLDSLRALPDTSGSDQYGTVYRRLKAHLITTAFSDSSSAQFLAPVLLASWQAGRRLDPERTELVRRQFDFYSRELPNGNPYRLKPDSAAVARARGFLARYSGPERVYQSMVAEAAKRGQPIRLDRAFPQSVALLRDPYEVPAGFTRAGWSQMQDALAHADRYLRGESWVLGEEATPTIDREQVLEQLRSRYVLDYIRHWESFVDSASLLPYNGLKDASQKLAVLSGNGSPLIALIGLAASQTLLAQPAVQHAFIPLHVLHPETTKPDSTAKSALAGYFAALDALQVAVERVNAAPVGGNDAAVQKALEGADLAKLEVKKAARAFGPEADRGVGAAVQQLLSEPITGAEGLLRNVGPAQMNSAVAAFCGPVRQLIAKYPFNQRATTPADPQEVAKVFQPGSGSLWTLYNDALQKVLLHQGSQYVPVESGDIRVNPDFVRFFNRAVVISEALYQSADAEPRLTFRLTPILPEAVASATLVFEGQTARFNSDAPETKPFVALKAAGRVAQLSAQFGEGLDLSLGNYAEPWAVFRLFGAADRWTPSPDGYTVQWTLRSGRADAPTVTAEGSAATVAFRLDLGGSAPVLKPGFFDGLGCPGTIAR